MKLEITTGYLPPVELGAYEHVTVILPSGRRVTVYPDKIYVSDNRNHDREKAIWEAMAPGSRKYPYGKVRPAGCGDEDGPGVAPDEGLGS